MEREGTITETDWITITAASALLSVSPSRMRHIATDRELSEKVIHARCRLLLAREVLALRETLQQRKRGRRPNCRPFG